MRYLSSLASYQNEISSAISDDDKMFISMTLRVLRGRKEVEEDVKTFEIN